MPWIRSYRSRIGIGKQWDYDHPPQASSLKGKRKADDQSEEPQLKREKMTSEGEEGDKKGE